MSLYALDIETVCNVEGCKGFGDYKKCNHALSPWHDRITIASAVSDEVSIVFHTVGELASWLFNNPQNTYTGHNFKFDLLHIWVHLEPHYLPLDRWVGDSMLASYVCTDKIPDQWLADYNIAKAQFKGQRDAGKHSLKTTAPYFLGVHPFWETENKEDEEYVTKDALYSLQLTQHMEARLRDLGQYDFYKESLLPWTKMLLQAEYRGICIDLEALKEKEVELTAKHAELTAKLNVVWAAANEAYADSQYEETKARYEAMANKKGLPLDQSARHLELFDKAFDKIPTKINYDSPKQMTWLLKDFLGYDITSLDGTESTGVEVLERLKSEGHEDVALFLELRSCEKLLSSFLTPYKEMAVNGVIHPSFNPARTTTGRLSSSSPNLQQVPPELKCLFVPRPGHKFISYDYSGIEAVLIAVYSDDPALYEIINNGLSIHDFNAKVFFDLDCPVKDVKKLYPREREAAKTVGFALFYSAGANRIRIAFTQAGFPITELQARNIHRRFKDAYSVAYSYGQQVIKHLEDGEVIPGLLGRPVKIQNAEDAFMTGFNSLIQGSASDINLFSAYNVIMAVPTVTALGFIHDSVLFEVPESIVDSVDVLINQVFTDYKLQTTHGPIKLKIEGGVQDKWSK